MVQKKDTYNKDIKKMSSKNIMSVKPSDWLNFSSAIAVVTASAIFFTSGWVYVATWFSFYGLNATELQIPTQLILINGVPGVFAAIFVGFLSFSLVFSQRYLSKEKHTSSYRLLLLIALTAEGAILVLFMLIALLLGLSVGWDFKYFFDVQVPNSFEFRNATLLAISILLNSIIAFIVVVAILVFLEYSENKKGRQGKNRFFGNISEFIIKIFRIPNVWTGFILLLYFVVAIIISYFMSEIDANRGGQLMSSNWKIPVVFIHSDREMSSFEYFRYSTYNPDAFIYGPLGLLYENSNGYYFVTLRDNIFYEKSPTVFFLPKEMNSSFLIEIQPKNDRILWNKDFDSQIQSPPLTLTPTAIVTETQTP